jgi:hypothetical protein
LYIGGTHAAQTSAFVASDFTSDSWIEVSWIENLGKVGDTSSEIAFSAIGANRTLKLKGVRNAGSMAVVAASVPSDTGQIAMAAAEADGSNNYAFKVEFNDRISSHGSQRFFIGQVMSIEESYDTVNNVIRINYTIGVNSNVVKVAAA